MRVANALELMSVLHQRMFPMRTVCSEHMRNADRFRCVLCFHQRGKFNCLGLFDLDWPSILDQLNIAPEQSQIRNRWDDCNCTRSCAIRIAFCRVPEILSQSEWQNCLLHYGHHNRFYSAILLKFQNDHPTELNISRKIFDARVSLTERNEKQNQLKIQLHTQLAGYIIRQETRGLVYKHTTAIHVSLFFAFGRVASNEGVQRDPISLKELKSSLDL